MTEPPKFVVLGTGGNFTFHVIDTLINKAVLPSAYVQAGMRDVNSKGHFDKYRLEVNHQFKPLDHSLHNQSVPFSYETEIDLLDYVGELAPDFILTACWPSLLSKKLLTLARKAAVNLHPSLLPKYRGKDPIAMQLKTHDHHFGVSLHLMNEYYDQGDIIAQRSINLGAGASFNEIENQTAKIGADLFIHGIQTYDQPGWNLIKQSSKTEEKG